MAFKRLFILIALLYITFIGGTAYSALNIVLRITLHLVVSGAVGWWLFGLIRRGRAWPTTTLDVPLLLLALWFGVSIAFSQDRRMSLEFAWPFFMHLLWLYMLVDTMRNRGQRWIFEALFITASVFVIIGLVEFVSWYFGLGFAGYEQGWFGIYGLNNPIPIGNFRLGLALNSATITGNYVVILLPLVLAWGLSMRRPDYRYALFGLAGGLGLVLFGTGSRGAFGALLPALATLFAFWLMRQTRWPLPIFKPRFIFPLIAAGVVACGLVLFLFAFRSANTSDQRRVDMWESALTLSQDDPLTGVGMGQFGAAYRPLRDTGLIQDGIAAAHNLYLNTLAEIGWPGVLLIGVLGVLFLQTWLGQWREADPIRRIRLEGVLASLAGLAVHSMIDTFTLSASVLPVLIAVAYTLAWARPRLFLPAPPLKYAALALVGVYFVLLVRFDIGTLRFMNALRLISEEEYSEALTALERAQAIDPDLRLYDAQRAQVLGLLADENPADYLDSAIAAYEAVLRDDPTFDTGWANLAALYAQGGAFEAALDAIQRARAIHPDYWEYDLKEAEYQAILGDEAAAIAAYLRALAQENRIAASDYWAGDEIRQRALDTLYQTWPTAEALQIALYRDDRATADRLSDHLDPVLPANALPLGRYAAYIEEWEAARQLYERHAEGVGVLEATQYVERGEVYLALGNLEAAEADARTALFLDPLDASRAYYILTQTETDASEAQINDWLLEAVPPPVRVQGYAAALYGRPAALGFLPQLALPGYGRIFYEPWFVLAERYAEDDDEDTDPATLFETMREEDPYLAVSD